MHEKILERISQLGARQEYVDERIVLNGRKYKSFSISVKNFNKIIDGDSFNGRVGFVDGGNCEILKAVNYSLQMIRVCGLVYSGIEKISMVKKEFYVLIYAAGGEDIVYRIEVYPMKGLIDLGYLEFNSLDRNLMDGNERAPISKIGGVVRRMAEIRLANELDADVIVLDGSMQTNLDVEKREMDELFKKNSLICGLCKTSRIFTDKGNSLISVLSKFGYEGEWYYNNLVEISDESYRAEIFGVKLNRNSKHIFIFEIFKKQSDDFFKVLSLLKKQSNDLIFPGYPYGLIEADKFARISNREKDYLLTLFKSYAGKSWEDIEKNLSSLDSHDKLDSIG